MHALDNAFAALRSLRLIFTAESLPAPEPSASMSTRALFDGLHLSQWRVNLARALGNRFGALVYVELNAHQERVIHAFGPAPAVARVHETFVWLSREVEDMAMASKLRGKTARQSYCVGFVQGLAQSLSEPLPGVATQTGLRAAFGRDVPEHRAPRTVFRESARAKGVRAGVQVRMHN